MAEQRNAPGPRNPRALQETDQTTTSQGSADACSGAGCGTCAITVLGTERWCEIERDLLCRLKRELAEALAGGGDRG